MESFFARGGSFGSRRGERVDGGGGIGLDVAGASDAVLRLPGDLEGEVSHRTLRQLRIPLHRRRRGMPRARLDLAPARINRFGFRRGEAGDERVDV